MARPGDEAGDLFTIHPDGSGLEQLTALAADGGSAEHPSFAPDASHIVFVADLGSDGGSALATVTLSGEDLGPATSSGYRPGRHPRVRPGT